MKEKENILVVGATSRVGAALVQKLGSRAIPVCRRPTGNPEEILVDDYAALPHCAFENVKRIINCVGVRNGPSDLLERLNVTVPLQIVEKAKEFGVKHVIHVSSFSVYGRAERIDRFTLTDPVGNYGRTKLRADVALLATSAPGLTVTTVRFPLIYAPNSSGKLGRLLLFWKRTRMIPVPINDIRRSMISVEMAAEVLMRLSTQRPMGGVQFAADPAPFTYQNAALTRSEMLFSMRIPEVFKRAAQRFLPELSSQLMTDSHLADSCNLALDYGITSQLYRDIASLEL